MQEMGIIMPSFADVSSIYPIRKTLFLTLRQESLCILAEKLFTLLPFPCQC